MTRKPLPKLITRPREDLRNIAASAVMDEEPQTPPSTSRYVIKAIPATTISSLRIAAEPLPEPQAARRRSLARKIVERHKMFAAMGGLFPVPIVNVAGVTAIIMRMVKQLSDLYAVPFERDRTRSVIIGFMGGAVPTGLGAVAASTLVFAIPAAGFIGLAVTSITAATLTRGIGLVFVEHYESGSMPLVVPEAIPA
jgi:uncharacterized protein (DUF697 family)